MITEMFSNVLGRVQGGWMLSDGALVVLFVWWTYAFIKSKIGGRRISHA